MKSLYKEWRDLQPLTPENQARLDRKMDLEFNYNSNHLEGNTLTYGQTELLLMFGETTGSARFRDYEEMQAHNVALRMVRQCAAEALSEVFVRQLGAAIFKMNNYDFRPNPVLEPAMMTSLVDWLNATEAAGELDPLELDPLLHYRFVRIHPFEDGNGRLARLLMNYVLMRHGLPMIVVRSAEKEAYLRALHSADLGVGVGLTPSDGANATLEQIGGFVDYMRSQMEYSFSLAIRAARGEAI